MNLRELWTDWPNREVTGLVKAYFLGQWAFWLQQVLVIHIEERRKDHWQMLTHHFITITLMTASYYYHHTRVGILILVLMDIVDIFLPVSPRPQACVSASTLSSPISNQLPAGKMPQVSRLFDDVRYHVRNVHGLMVLCSTCILYDGVLEYLEGCHSCYTHRLFLWQQRQSERATSYS